MTDDRHAGRDPRPTEQREVRILSLPEVRNFNVGVGNEIAAGSPEEFLSYIRQEMEKWGKVIKATGVRGD